jgi:hypothetical protein
MLSRGGEEEEPIQRQLSRVSLEAQAAVEDILPSALIVITREGV